MVPGACTANPSNGAAPAVLLVPILCHSSPFFAILWRVVPNFAPNMPSVEKVGKRWKGVARKMVNGEQIKRTRNFATKREAMEWAREEEGILARGEDTTALNHVSFSQLIKRYLHEVTPSKKSAEKERMRFNRFIADYPHIARKTIATFNRRDVVAWKEARGKLVSADTVIREWNSLSAVISCAQKDWGLPIADNPFQLVRKPKAARPRHQRVTPEDAAAIVEGLRYNSESPPQSKREQAAWCFLFALETAMRAGEILKMQPEDVTEQFVTLHDTKNGADRIVPLSQEARRLLSLVQLPLSLTSGTLDALYRKYRPQELKHIRFHDTRHEALSRMAHKVSNPMTLAKISGHKDIKILLNTYYNPKGEDLAGILD